MNHLRGMLCRLFGHRWRPADRFDARRYLFDAKFTWVCERCGCGGAADRLTMIDIRVVEEAPAQTNADAMALLQRVMRGDE